MAHYFSDNHTRQTDTPVVAASPKVCPACASATIASTAKVQSAEAYWRCLRCGEVWSPARRLSPSTRRW